MDKIVFPTYNGIVVHCGDKKVASVTNCDGQKKLKSFREKNKVVFWHFPFFRGLQYFFCGIWALFQAVYLSYDMCGEKNKKIKDLNKYYISKTILISLTMVLGILFSAMVLGFLPGKLGYLLLGYDQSDMLRNVVIMIFKFVLFYAFIAMLRIFPIVREFFRFNRAGEIVSKISNKTKDLKIKASKKQTPLPNFLNFVIFLNYIII